MSVDLAKFVLEARSAAKLTETQNAALQKKLVALAIDLLAATKLEDARGIADGATRSILDYTIGKMTLPQLKKVSKAWNPNRAAIPAEIGLSDLRKELGALLNGADPAPAPVKKAGARRASARK
jgi:uncharacterized protein YigA (DUF484 family)